MSLMQVPSMGMSNCFSDTPLSHELANALSASPRHLQELQAAESQQQPQPQQPNPFQEASTFYPPITSQPSAHDLVIPPDGPNLSCPHGIGAYMCR